MSRRVGANGPCQANCADARIAAVRTDVRRSRAFTREVDALLSSRRVRRTPWIAGGVTAALALALLIAPATAQAATNPAQISTDTFTNASSQHEAQVEPDTFAYGSTIVAA